MGLNTLINKTSNDVIDESWPNAIHQALKGDFVGRGENGAPLAGQNLGTAAFPWGSLSVERIFIDGNLVDLSLAVAESYQLTSSRTRANGRFPEFLKPAGPGNGLSFELIAEPTPISLVINGALVEYVNDLLETGLSPAPSTNNTATVSEPDANGAHSTRFWGLRWFNPNRDRIRFSAPGSEITALNGSWQSFQLGSEILFGYIEGNAIVRPMRGFFLDTNHDAIKAQPFNNSATLTLLRTGYVFLDADGITIDVVYKMPARSNEAPASPSTGDYWFDFTEKSWKVYDGTAWVTQSRIFVGYIVNNATDCIAYRPLEFFGAFESVNSLHPRSVGVDKVKNVASSSLISVAGSRQQLDGLIEWDLTTDLVPIADMFDAALTASRPYFYYLTEQFKAVVSDIPPYYRGELKGFYHPYQTWRCVYVTPLNAASEITGDLSENGNLIVSQGFGELPAQSIGFAQMDTTALRPGLIAVQVFNASGTYDKRINNPRWIKVTVVGGGGGGGGCAILAGAAPVILTAGSGAGGGTAIRSFFSAEIPDTVTVTVGAAGAGGTNAPTGGGAGGTSSFGAFMTGSGGGGGAVCNAGSPILSPSGAASVPLWRVSNGGVFGPASGGQINVGGAPGSHGPSRHGGGTYYSPSVPANILLGVPGAQQPNRGIGGRGGHALVNPSTSGGEFGGAGSSGVVIVEEYL